MISNKCRVFRVPGGFVDGWISGYKANAEFIDGEEWSVYLQCKYSTVCELFSSGIMSLVFFCVYRVLCSMYP